MHKPYGLLWSFSPLLFLLFYVHYVCLCIFFNVQYCEKVMQTIIGQYRENRHISAIINEILFETKYRTIFRDVYCFSCREISPTPVRYFVAA